MNKLFTLFIAIFIFSSTIIAQSFETTAKPDYEVTWEEMMLRPEYSLKEVQDAFYKRWENKEYVKDDGYKLFKRWEYWTESIVGKDGKFDKNKVKNEYLRYKEKVSNGFYRESGGEWEQLGPFGFISEYGIGRVNVVAFDPNDANVLWLGSPSGGLWKSINGGLAWESYSNDYRMMGVSDIAIDHTNTDIMYIATGDRDANDTYSYGVLKSTDGGVTWGGTGFPSVGSVSRVLINPQNNQEITVSTNRGIYKSNNAGDSWHQTLSGKFIKHMEFKPGDYSIIYATDYSYSNANSAFYRSQDNGENFTKITVEGLPSTVGILSIGVTEDNPNTVILMAGINKSGWDGEDFEGIYKSVDSGLTFSKVDVLFPPELGSQSWYDWTFVVAPDNQNEMYAGGVRYYKSGDGGVSWSQLGNWDNPNNNHSFHVDHHFAGFQPSTNVLFVGNDGGIYKSENRGRYWTGLNEDLSITQYYKMGTSSRDEGLVICGAQDNGSHLLDDNLWERVMGGDGMDCAIDYSNSNIIYASYQNGYIRKSRNRGNSFRYMISSDLTHESGAWVTPIVIDPVNPNILYAGYESVWQSEDKGDNWVKISNAFVNQETIRGVKMTPANNDYIYIHYWRKIYKSEDKGDSWTEVSKPSGFTIKDIAVSPANPEKIWVAIDNSVYKSVDGGDNWEDITGTLPNVPVTSLVVQKNDIESIYLGTYIGIFYIDNTLSDWIPFNGGLPPVRIGELEINPEFGKIRAATFGRGLWESHLYDFNSSLPLCTSITAPENGIRITDENITFQWREIGNANGYKISIGTEPGLDDIVSQLDLGNNTSYIWNDIQAEGKIFVSVLTYNDQGEIEACYDNFYYVGCVFDDRQALIDIYNSTGGDNWNNKWDTTECDISKWYGVRTNISGRVISLDFDGIDNDKPNVYIGNNLTGVVSSEAIGKLKNLKNLFLSGNDIGYDIFESIAGLEDLERIDLSNNKLTGGFPDSLTGLKKLKYLDLSNNDLSGEISARFNNWSKMEYFALRNNRFSGSLPSSISALKKCEEIDFSNNEFTGSIPFTLWFSQLLSTLNLSDNNFSGRISNQIYNAKNLKFLILDNNSISGKIPKRVGDLSLFYLSIKNNNLEGCFPDNLKKLCDLGSIVYFDGNKGLPNNGDFSKFCGNDIGNCDKIPDCSVGLASMLDGDSLYYDQAFNWFKVDKAGGYRISVGTSSGGVDIVDNVDVGADTLYKANELPKYKEIFVNIIPYNNYGHAYGCDEFSFYTKVHTAVVENDTIDFGSFVKVYPIPATNVITFEKKTNELKDIGFEILNIDGVLVHKEILEKEKIKKSINIKSLPKGVYLIKMNIEERIYYKKLVVQ